MSDEAERRGMEYLRTLPKAVPAGKVLAHNVRWSGQRSLGLKGFRAWLQAPDPEALEVCDCAWAPKLGRHFRRRPLQSRLVKG